jgi:hypothetical protein
MFVLKERKCNKIFKVLFFKVLLGIINFNNLRSLKMKKRLSLVIAVFALFAMTAVSFAANTANINVTSEPIRQAATCDKAGGFAISFDHLTTFKGGDQITFDLDFGVTLCRAIDLEVGIDTNIAGPDASNFTGSFLLPALGSASPLTGTGLLTSANRGILFKIIGTNGSQRVTINLMSDVNGDGTLESDDTAELTFTGTQSTDDIELSFLDQATYAPGPGAAGIFAPNAIGIYDLNDATVAQNTLCIDVSDPTFVASGATTVDANFDSKDDKYTWIPSDPQIAHVIASSQFDFVTCKGRNPGYIMLPGTATQNNPLVQCLVIENEWDAGDGTDAFCWEVVADRHANNKVIINTANGQPFESTNYQIQLDILVDGQPGENGVYWTNEVLETDGYTTQALACAALEDDGEPLGGVATYTLASGTAATPVAAITNCIIPSAARAVTMLTVGDDLDLGVSDAWLYIDLPGMHFDSTFVAGQVLSVKVTLLKAPCGELFVGTWEIGTAGCTAAAIANNIRYPYFAKTGAYANALIITNYSAADGTANITIYEQDGDAFTASVPVLANSLFVDLLGNLVMTQISGAGTFGDARSYVIISGDFAIDGAAMITNPATGESIGYLPRLVLVP